MYYMNGRTKTCTHTVGFSVKAGLTCKITPTGNKTEAEVHQTGAVPLVVVRNLVERVNPENITFAHIEQHTMPSLESSLDQIDASELLRGT